VSVQASGKGTPIGTVIHNNDGGILGTVMELDPAHRFENGETATGVALKRPEADHLIWYPTTALENFWVTP